VSIEKNEVLRQESTTAAARRVSTLYVVTVKLRRIGSYISAAARRLISEQLAAASQFRALQSLGNVHPLPELGKTSHHPVWT
jgi:hypothetical protein